MKTRQLGRAIALAVLLCAAALPASAQPRAAIRYTLRFPAPQTNYVGVGSHVRGWPPAVTSAERCKSSSSST